MKSICKFKPGDRIVVWITNRDDVYEGDAGTVIKITPSIFKNNKHIRHPSRVTVILDTGIKIESCTEDKLIHEKEYDPNIPF